MRKNRLLTILLVFCLLLQFTPPASAAAVVSQGTVGSLQWTLDSQGVLTISGTGAMQDYVEGIEFSKDGIRWIHTVSAHWIFDRNQGKSIGDLIKTVVVKDGVTSIGSAAFYGCKNLVSVSLPSTVQSIGTAAFKDCTSLTTIQMPASLQFLGDAVFYNCSSLTSVAFPAGLELVPIYTFYGCRKLQSVSIPAGTLGVDYSAFQNCESLTSIAIPEGILALADYAFDGCTALQSISLPSTLIGIATYAFRNCKSLQAVQLPPSLTYIWEGAFSDCTSLREIQLSPSLGYLAPAVFYRCSALEHIDIPASVDYIGYETFYGCQALQSVTLHEGLTTIGEEAFLGCTSLTDINIPNSIQEVYMDAFAQCSSLKSLVIPGHQRVTEPAFSANENQNNYLHYDLSPIQSYLYSDGSDLVRAEYASGQLYIERYSKDFVLQSSRTVTLDAGLIWGGLFIGDRYNFVFTGKENPSESDSAEVIYITKYDNGWNKLDETAITGANTHQPFAFGTLRCAEEDGILYVFTCHTMYDIGDGVNHQANMLFSVRERDLSVRDTHWEISGDYGYVSHSLNQFILIDSRSRLLTLDQGDTYPRAAILNRYEPLSGTGKISDYDSNIEYVHILEFPNNTTEYQRTGVSIGGLAETADGYITAYNDNRNGGQDDSASRDIYLSFTDKDNFSGSGTAIRKVTSYGSSESAGTPVLVSTGLDGGYVLWNEQQRNAKGDLIPTQRIAYVQYDADGNVTAVQTAAGALSDCPPIVQGGKVIWYTTDGVSLTFYTLDSTGLHRHCQAPYRDNPEDAWYHDAVQYVASKGWVRPKGWLFFYPEDLATRWLVAEALYQLEGCPKTEPYSFEDIPASDNSDGDAPSWAARNQIFSGYGNGNFGPRDAVTREQLAAILYHYAAYLGINVSQRADLSRFTDSADIHDWASEALSWANAVGLMSGSSGTTMSPLRSLTRGELAAVLMNFHRSILQGRG